MIRRPLWLVPLLALLLAGPGRLAAADKEQEAADEKTLQAGKLANEGPALLKYLQQRTVTEEDRAKIVALIRELGDDDFGKRQDALEKLQKYGLAAVGLLRQGERDPDIQIVRHCERCLRKIETVPSGSLTAAAVRMLAKHKPPGTSAALMAYLPMADDDTVADEVRNTLTAIVANGGEADKVILAALTDKLAVRRAAAAEALARSGKADLQAKARAMFKDADGEVRLRAALNLAITAKSKDAVPVLIDLLGELEPSQGWPAEEALCRLAGDDAPAVSLSTDKAERVKCRDAWKGWWAKAGDKTDLAKLSEGTRFLGYTMVLEMDLRGGNGRVIELGADKKPRWTATGLQMPLDAQVLSRDRILVAEHNGGRITERELKGGKILWSHFLNAPVACERLPNGNTFMAGRSQVIELTADKKEVVNINRQNFGDIVAAKRTRAGEYYVLTNVGQCMKFDSKGKELKTFGIGPVNYYSYMDLLPNGHILVTQQNAVAEYDPEKGKSVWSVTVNNPTSVQRLPNGNTLVTSLNTMQVLELNREGKTVWEYKSTDNHRPWRARRR